MKLTAEGVIAAWGGGGRKIRGSRSSSGTQKVQGQTPCLKTTIIAAAVPSRAEPKSDRTSAKQVRGCTSEQATDHSHDAAVRGQTYSPRKGSSLLLFFLQ